MALPIVPRNPADRTGQGRREKGAIAEFERRLARVRQVYQDALDRIPFEEVTVNARFYEFRLDQSILSNMFELTGRLVDEILLEGGENQLWFALDYVVPAYQQGSAQTLANLSAQSRAYAATRGTITDLVRSDPYQRRLGMLLAREFEEMSGYTASVKKSMGFILSQGLATGVGPREISARLTTQLAIEQRAANRVARTEITTALHNARLEEAQAAVADLGIRLRMMHLSALSPTTRLSHAIRHGNLFGIQAQRVWWSMDANSINCKCTAIEVIVDEAGQPLNPDWAARIRLQGREYRESLAA